MRRLDSIWRELAGVRERYGATEVATVIAEMLAAIRLLPQEGQDSLLKRERELTAQDWSYLQYVAATAWQDDVALLTSSDVSPFGSNPTTERYQPGYFELVRLAVVDLVTQRDLLKSREAMFEACLALAEDLGERGGEHMLRPEVAKLLAEVVVPRAKQRAYCAFSASAQSAMHLAFRGLKVTLQVQTPEVASFWLALSVAAQLQLQVRVGDPFQDLLNEWSEISATYDVAVVTPPFGAKVTLRYPLQSGFPPPASEAWGVALAALRSRHTAACLLPNGFLFRNSLSDQAFKAKAIQRYGLQTVVSLPPGAAARGSAVSTSVVILTPSSPVSDILMVDAADGRTGRQPLGDGDVAQVVSLVRNRRSDGSSRLVDEGEIAHQNFNLSPERYVLSPEARRADAMLQRGETVALEDLVDIYRPQATPGHLVDPDVAYEPNAWARELAVSDLDDLGLAGRPSKHLLATPMELPKLRKAELRPGDVLLVTKGSAGRVGYVSDIPQDELWVANQSFAILRLRKNAPIIDPKVLFRFLSSGLGQELVQRLKVGSTIATLQMADVRRIPILVPSPEKQAKVAADVGRLFGLQAQIAELRSRILLERHTMWPKWEDN